MRASCRESHAGYGDLRPVTLLKIYIKPTYKENVKMPCLNRDKSLQFVIDSWLHIFQLVSGGTFEKEILLWESEAIFLSK